MCRFIKDGRVGHAAPEINDIVRGDVDVVVAVEHVRAGDSAAYRDTFAGTCRQ